MRLLFISLCACLSLFHVNPSLAEDEPTPVGYLSLDPEAEHHLPLMRAVIIDVIGKKDEAQIKSLTGREVLRLEILKELRMALKSELGEEVIKDLFFTKYLYNT